MKKLLLVIVLLAGAGAGGLYFLGKQSQEGVAAGLVSGQLAPCPSTPNCVSSEVGTSDQQWVQALPASVWPAIPGVIEQMGGTVTVRDSNYLAAEFTSNRFKFVDDVEFRRADSGVHVRSASRVGYSDAGVNETRVDAIRQRLGG